MNFLPMRKPILRRSKNISYRPRVHLDLLMKQHGSYEECRHLLEDIIQFPFTDEHKLEAQNLLKKLLQSKM